MTDKLYKSNNEGIPTEENLCDIDLSEWKSYFFTSNCNKLVDNYGTFRIIKKILTNDINKPNLVAMAGFSTKSFCGTTKRIIENINKIKNKFNAIYILQYDEEKFKELQRNACQMRDKNKSTKTSLEEIYQPETDLNEELGTIIDKLFRCMGLTKVHLLGKCAGGGVAIHVFTKSDIYEALYLGVPASPTSIKHIIDNIDYANIHNKKFIFAWDQMDAYPFDWGIKSNEEKERYDKYKDTLIKNHNTVITAQFNTETDETDAKKYHEIPHGLFDLI